MADAFKPEEVYEKAAKEGERRLDLSLVALLATGFIAGFTIVFGSAAQAIVEAAALPHFGEFSSVLGALAFGTGVVFLVLGRAELFSENFFDPVATLVERKNMRLVARIGRLWVLTLVLNLAGGIILIFVFSVDGVLTAPAQEVMVAVAEGLANREAWATFARSIIGGALVALLSFLVLVARSSGSRMAAAYMVGVLLALGPFEHVVVSSLHMIFGMFLGADVGLAHVARVASIAFIGNLVGGVGLVTLSHTAQALGEERGK